VPHFIVKKYSYLLRAVKGKISFENSLALLIPALREEKILKTLRESSGRRPSVLAFAELLNAVEGRKVI
jgi:hypothetical protein